MKTFELDDMSILSILPKWTVHWGIYILTLFFVIIIYLSSIISYNESITAPLIISSTTPIVHVRAKTNGVLENGYFETGSKVNEGSIIGIMDHDGNSDDIFELLSALQTDSLQLVSTKDLASTFSFSWQLENTIIPKYSDFLNAYTELITHDIFDVDTLKIENNSTQLNLKNLAIGNKKRAITSLERKLDIASVDYSRHQNLYKKGIISTSDLEKHEKEFLLIKNDLYELKEGYNEIAQSSTRAKFEQRIEENQKQINKNLLHSKLYSNKQYLIASIEKWKVENIILSPISGILTFPDYYNKLRNVEKGDVIYTIIPNDNDEIIGKCKSPIYNSSKIKEGQKVIIRLDNYNYTEFGTLKGKVLSISDIPDPIDKNSYQVYIKLDNLITSYGKELSFKHEMPGSAEIILERTTLLKRIFHQFRSLWDGL